MKNLFEPSVYREVRSRIEELSQEDQRQFGSMTPEQVICHLHDSLKGSQDPELAAKFKSSLLSNALGRWLIIASPIPWPKGKIRIPPELESFFFRTQAKGAFEEHKKQLLEELDAFALGDPVLQRNAIFGELSKKQWGMLHYRHFNHHLSQFSR